MMEHGDNYKKQTRKVRKTPKKKNKIPTSTLLKRKKPKPMNTTQRIKKQMKNIRTMKNTLKMMREKTGVIWKRRLCKMRREGWQGEGDCWNDGVIMKDGI